MNGTSPVLLTNRVVDHTPPAGTVFDGHGVLDAEGHPSGVVKASAPSFLTVVCVEWGCNITVLPNTDGEPGDKYDYDCRPT